ncbi:MULTISPECIES: endonuclease MutS2 [Clostridia]|jgi:DNA mismatch repair protein MutS2|uniref:endonuclease MutS2 n=1 Tax=Clostridia TaxID=186801 RepID=UPI000E5222E8|nr:MULTISPECIES: endonuclease MutS2 [Clostridia]RGH38957.1 endonuclease MutS2 [Firmicutes bacterium AM41-5BH]RHT36786.1 endonuclease MutS2 [Firmicutes bacterium AM31-12AC]RKQ26718.1 endonuclease MutS2 [Ruminococcus sp. B05]TAP30351.1 endonuclease MutS2 [Mediterraneibacter sp. gm002]
MNQKTLTKLEYHKIIAMLEEQASSFRGRQLCRKLKPMTNLNKINTSQEQTAAAFTRLIKKGRISFSDAAPVEESMKRLEVGAALGSGELLRILKLLQTAGRVKAYGRHDTQDELTDCLDAYFEQLEPLTLLANEIERCIISEDEISDDASSTLKHIRRNINNMNDKVHATLTNLVNGSLRTYLQDPIITMRGDRYCLPVKAECRGNVQGMIHDQSSTGSTLFIEPMAVVKLNNDLKELYAKEQEEIQVILARLSEDTAEYIEEIRTDYRSLTDLDFIFARGRLALEMNGSRPLFNTEGRIYIREGRHPLLDARKVVPITISLGKDFTLLIVTGPNTGGKTVSLKTVGLLTLMGQAGLHIPAGDHSELAVFHQVYADIGDEQSIEQSLSTFSSHMTNIVSFLQDVDENSLVLFDELGAGTDPTEGAALATAILSYLHKRGIRAMATTHYSELKVYALSTPGVENACCEFDVESLKPTYRLLIGIPGKSNAFAISSKLGIPDYIIEDAKKRLTEQDVSFEDMMTDLETSKRTIEKEREEIAAYKREIEALKMQTRQKQDKLDEQRERILREANEKANAILRDAKDVADETIKNFRKFGKENISAADMEKERERLRKKIKDTSAASTIKAQKPKKAYKPSDFKLGESVKVLSMNLTGTISSKPDSRGNVTVQMGILRSQVNISDLEIIEDVNPYSPKAMKRTSKSKIKMSKSLSVSPEINLLGKTVDEAVSELDKYLDDALLSHLNSVRVVHGKGTGALRKGIHEYLRRQKHVKSYRLAEYGEGDAGVTIVELK